MPFFIRISISKTTLCPSWMWFTYVVKIELWIERHVWKIVPLSSRTKDSSSAILFRSRVLSSSDGSSLKKKNEKYKVNLNIFFSTWRDQPQCRIVDFIDTKTRLIIVTSKSHRGKRRSKGTDQAQLYTSLARPFSVTLIYMREKMSKKGEKNTRTRVSCAHLSFGCMAIQATLCGSVPPPFPIFG
jgi:hypothetical protein